MLDALHAGPKNHFSCGSYVRVFTATSQRIYQKTLWLLKIISEKSAKQEKSNKRT